MGALFVCGIVYHLFSQCSVVVECSSIMLFVSQSLRIATE